MPIFVGQLHNSCQGIVNMRNKYAMFVQIFEACAKECKRYTDMDHCQKCAQACRRCAEECRKM